MGQNFIDGDRGQQFLMPPNVRDWLPPEHFAWFVIDAVEQMDLARFYERFGAPGPGRPAYEPRLMVALVLYAYCVGERSSRAIERRCREDVAFRVVAANLAPDHATIARFRCKQQDAISGLFGEVLEICRDAGLVSTAVLAVDSTKLAADASGHQNRSYEQIAREILADAARIDAEEDALYGDKRGDELPEELANPVTRKARLREAKARFDARKAAETEKAKEREDHAEELAQEGRKPMGRRPKPFDPDASPQGRLNVTDLDSHPMRTPRGFIQGYNAHAVATADQIIVAAELTQLSADGGELLPMVAAARDELSAIGQTETFETVLADAGYWKNEDITALQRTGARVLVPPDKDVAKPNLHRSAPVIQRMRAALLTDEGAELYKRRQQIIEPLFGDIKHNRKAGRFKRRGVAACRSEWQLICATSNLLKAWRATPAAQTA